MERSDKAMKLGLCFKCLDHGHLSKDCSTKLECIACHKTHATANHGSVESQVSGNLDDEIKLDKEEGKYQGGRNIHA